MSGNFIGYEINERYSQISFYNEELQEPQTVETMADNYQIPLAIAYVDGKWYAGTDAKRQRAVKNAVFADKLYEKAVRRDKVKFLAFYRLLVFEFLQNFFHLFQFSRAINRRIR